MGVSKEFAIASDYILLSIALLIPVTNFLLIALIAKNRHLRTVTNSFIISLSASDILVSPALLTFILLKHASDNDVIRYGNLVSLIILSVSPVSALVSGLFVSLDRFCAVCYPLTYARKVNMRKAKSLICIIWFCTSAFVGAFMFHFIDKQPTEILKRRVSPKTYIPRRLLIIAYGIPLSLLVTLTIFLNFRILIALKRNNRRISVMCGTRVQVKRSAGESLRITRMMLMAMAIQIGLWVPKFVAGYLPVSDTNLILSSVAYWLQCMNSILNPMIYIVMNKSYKKAFINIIGNIFKFTKTHAADTTLELDISNSGRQRRVALVLRDNSYAGAMNRY